jgi:hypothetical protein
MDVLIRQATAQDASQWLELLRFTLGDDYPDKQVYDPVWIAAQLGAEAGPETWIAELGGQLQAVISFLPPIGPNHAIAHLGRFLVRTNGEAGASEVLLKKVTEIALEREQVLVARVLASDQGQQTLFEKLGYTCAGFQPFKHLHRSREGTLFYLRSPDGNEASRTPFSESLPQIHELASAALLNLKLTPPSVVRDGVVGYPLQTELIFHEATFDDFELWQMHARTANPPVEISPAFNLGIGYLRAAAEEPIRAVLAQHEEEVVAGLAYHFDRVDRCVRLVNSFARDDLSMGALLRRVVKIAQEQFSSVYVEVDLIMTAPRLVKSAEQLGFVPIAYFPAFHLEEGKRVDMVKMVKLNMIYSSETVRMTPQAAAVVEIIDRNFQDQKVGVAIINLLRALPIFEGLGDGELRKMAGLCTQQLFRGGDRIFDKGDSGNEAYVVMRGQVDIVLEPNTKPIATMGNGQIFGELAFLDGAARVAMAVANQPSILLVIQRSAFNNLVKREPHLGMVIMRNVAIELSNRLRRTNAALLMPKN